jgi:hypothetical protein
VFAVALVIFVAGMSHQDSGPDTSAGVLFVGFLIISAVTGVLYGAGAFSLLLR